MNVHRKIDTSVEAEAESQGDLLVADLDRVLLRNSLKSEQFWNILATDRRALFQSGPRRIDAALLAYDAGALAALEDWRAKGGRTALYAECDEATALAVSLHLGCIDLVLASGSGANLRGEERARWIARNSGHDSHVELARPRAGHEALRGPRAYLKALRPHQWLKNTLIFAPLAAAHTFGANTILAALLAFAAFSAVASGVYVLNDLLDLAPDRAHPRKRKRPFASGAVPLWHGGWMAAVLFATGAGISALLGPAFVAAMLAYFILTTAYSLHLKRHTVIDICILGLLYTMRIVAGGVATGIALSVWLLAFSLFFFFSLAAVKRQAELVDNAARKELSPSGRGYHIDDLPIISMIAIGAGYVSVLVMALYVNSPDVLKLYPQPAFLWGICCVLLFWITRTVLLAHRGQMHDDPVVYAAKDRTSLACGASVLLCAILGVFA